MRRDSYFSYLFIERGNVEQKGDRFGKWRRCGGSAAVVCWRGNWTRFTSGSAVGDSYEYIVNIIECDCISFLTGITAISKSWIQNQRQFFCETSLGV